MSGLDGGSRRKLTLFIPSCGSEDGVAGINHVLSHLTTLCFIPPTTQHLPFRPPRFHPLGFRKLRVKAPPESAPRNGDERPISSEIYLRPSLHNSLSRASGNRLRAYQRVLVDSHFSFSLVAGACQPLGVNYCRAWDCRRQPRHVGSLTRGLVGDTRARLFSFFWRKTIRPK